MKMKKNDHNLTKSMIAVVAASVIAWGPTMAHADINSEMADMFNSMGSNTSYTQSGAYFSQSASMYTGGGFSARWGNKSINPFNVQLPSVSAGCGGIDFFAGAFSFANKEQFVQFVRNLGNNAAGVAFEVALDALDPLIGGAISKIRDLVNKMNNFNMNSCQLARTAVNGIAGQIGQAWQTGCEAEAIANGGASDGSEAKFKCQNDPYYQSKQRLLARGNDFNAAMKGENHPVEFTGGNVTLFALDKFNATNEEKRWLLSILGTMVAPAPKPNGANEPVKIEYKPPLINSVDDIVNFAGVDSANKNIKIKLYRCFDPQSAGTISFDGYKATQCEPEDVTYKSLKSTVAERLDTLKSNIRNGVASTNNTDIIKLIENADMPVLRMAAMDVMNKGSGNLTGMAVDAITYSIATKYMNDLLGLGQQVLGKYTTQSESDRKAINDALVHISAARDRFAKEKEIALTKASNQMVFNDYVKKLNEQFKVAFPQIQNSISLSGILAARER